MDLPPALIVPPEKLRDPVAGAGLEWIETDGRGGYASGTAIGGNTRRYHGLLVVATRPPTGRQVLLSRFEETLVIPGAGPEGGDGRFDLGTNFYIDAVHPCGYRLLTDFRLDPWPIWTFRIGSVTLRKSLFLAREPGVVVLRYRVHGGGAGLELRPLLAGRDFHTLMREDGSVRPEAEVGAGEVRCRTGTGAAEVVISHDGGAWEDSPLWYWRTLYPRETERGLDDTEDLFCPGLLRAELKPGRSWTLACGAEPAAVEQAGEWESAERHRRSSVAAGGRRIGGAEPGAGDLAARLALAGDAFLVERGSNRSILAGYPWFADWGRDSMIALPGLCLATGRLEDARSVLRAFSAQLRDGLIPNRFPDHGGEVPADHYNSVDASLWFIEAVGALADEGVSVSEFYPAISEIIEACRHGTRYGIRLHSDHLLAHGEEGEQLTWMDARVDGWVVTPRDGKAVEINALWYNALRRAAGLARAGQDRSHFLGLAERTAASFQAFWNPAAGCLYDRIDAAGRPDPAIRPNQLFAVSLPHSALRPEQAAAVVEVAGRDLLAPLAVRTLAPADPAYIGRYAGDRRARDSAYHRGTAWPWLLGAYAVAYLRVNGGSVAARAEVRRLLAPLPAHLEAYGLGHVSEVFSGDPPFSAGGCYAQAWSCSEFLRILRILGDPARAGWPDLDSTPVS